MALCAALESGNEALTLLHLTNNTLGNKTAAMFGALLASNCTLTNLDLSWNQIKVLEWCMVCVYMCQVGRGVV